VPHSERAHVLEPSRFCRQAHRIRPVAERVVTGPAVAARPSPPNPDRYVPSITAGEGAEGKTPFSSPAYWPTGSPRRSWCRWPHRSRPSGSSPRAPGARALMGQAPHGTLQPASCGLGRGRATSPASSAGHRPFHTDERSAFSACCFAGKLRSLAPLAERPDHPAQLRVVLLRQPLRTPSAYPLVHRSAPLPLVAPPSWGQLPARTRRQLAPPGGVGASAPQGALRAIDSTARPRLRRTYGPRRLWRPSQVCPGCQAG